MDKRFTYLLDSDDEDKFSQKSHPLVIKDELDPNGNMFVMSGDVKIADDGDPLEQDPNKYIQVGRRVLYCPHNECTEIMATVIEKSDGSDVFIRYNHGEIEDWVSCTDLYPWPPVKR